MTSGSLLSIIVDVEVVEIEKLNLSDTSSIGKSSLIYIYSICSMKFIICPSEGIVSNVVGNAVERLRIPNNVIMEPGLPGKF